MEILGLVTLLLVGCGGGAAAEPTPEATAASEYASGAVMAEAAIEPARWSALSFEIGGTVAEVLVAPGQVVDAGDEIVRLDPTDARLAVEEARAALASARANLAQLEAGPRPEEIAAAEHDLNGAQAALSRAAAQRDQVTDGATQADIAAARAELAAAEAQYRQALHHRDGVYDRYDVDTSKPERGYMDGDINDEDRVVQEADYQLNAAREALAAAQRALEAQQATADDRVREAQAGVLAASAQRDVAQAELALVQAGHPSWEIASARALVQQAEVALAGAEAQLARVVLRAPFDGTVTQVDAEVGDTVAPGQALLVLAALNQLQARTVDLTELDVAQVGPGQPVQVEVDALPDRVFQGVVSEVGLQAGEYRGDVVYDVVIDLPDVDGEPLLWGMRALVRIDT